MRSQQLDWNKWRLAKQLALEEINEVRSVTFQTKSRLLFPSRSFYVLFTFNQFILKYNQFTIWLSCSYLESLPPVQNTLLGNMSEIKTGKTNLVAQRSYLKTTSASNLLIFQILSRHECRISPASIPIFSLSRICTLYFPLVLLS